MQKSCHAGLLYQFELTLITILYQTYDDSRNQESMSKGNTMKTILVKSFIVALFATSISAQATALNRQQKDTVVGAVVGGAAGAAIGNDMVSTVSGAALGGVIGSQWNDHKRKDSKDYRNKGDKKSHKSKSKWDKHKKHSPKKYKRAHPKFA